MLLSLTSPFLFLDEDLHIFSLIPPSIMSHIGFHGQKMFLLNLSKKCSDHLLLIMFLNESMWLTHIGYFIHVAIHESILGLQMEELGAFMSN